VNPNPGDLIIQATGQILGPWNNDPAWEKAAGILWDENVRSVCCRYSNDKPSNYGAFVYKYPLNTKALSPMEIFGCIRNLDYQSCEADDYCATPAYHLIEQFTKWLGGTLPDYKETASACSLSDMLAYIKRHTSYPRQDLKAGDENLGPWREIQTWQKAADLLKPGTKVRDFGGAMLIPIQILKAVDNLEDELDTGADWHATNAADLLRYFRRCAIDKMRGTSSSFLGIVSEHNLESFHDFEPTNKEQDEANEKAAKTPVPRKSTIMDSHKAPAKPSLNSASDVDLANATVADFFS
jgi:hypothetical protein